MKKVIYIFLLGLAILTACDTTVKTGVDATGRILPNVTGAAGEVLVIMDNALWEGEAGEALKDVLQREFPALPQSEPMFSTPHLSPGSFDKMNRYHRSVVLVTMKASAEKTQITFKKDVWAKPQIVVQIESPNKASLIESLKRNEEKIQNYLIQYDRQRIADSYKSTLDPTLQKMIAENHQILLDIPRGYNIDVSTDNYSSISIESSDLSQVLHVFEYPMTGNGDLDSKRLLKQRNVYTKKYVKGPQDGSYMTTSKMFPPIFYDLRKDDLDIVEMRGLWELENGYMGGPFISHSFVDKNRNRVVTVEGYVFYPNQRKRVKVRQLEAIIYSMKLIQ